MNAGSSYLDKGLALVNAAVLDVANIFGVPDYKAVDRSEDVRATSETAGSRRSLEDDLRAKVCR